jgi:hypothetical protein
LYAVTYVSSPKAFERIAQRFRKVEFILGTPDSDFAANVASIVGTLNMDEEAGGFWTELTPDTREKVSRKQINIRYPHLGVTIHSKIYLMQNSKTGANRLVVGSANLSDTAWTSRPQFEEIIAYDNSDFFNLFMDRFWAIHKCTRDYIPENLKRCTDTDRISMFLADQSAIEKALQQALQDQKALYVSEDAINTLELMQHRSLPKQIYKIDRAVKTLRLTKHSGKKGSNIVSPATIIATLPKLPAALPKQSVNQEEHHTNSVFLYDDVDKVLRKQKDNLAYPLAREASIDEIRSGLNCIHAFVDAYNLFTYKEDPENQARVMEAILYAFMGPYLWKAREDLVEERGQVSSRAAIPPLLIIGGKARSGKTTLLEFINKLIDPTSRPTFFQYPTIEKQLRNMIDSDNLHPILVDEMPPAFFRSKKSDKGEEFIKYMANIRESKHPILIATTNHDNFSIGDQSRRRTYYLAINNTFDETKAIQSGKHLEQTLAQANNTLFCDYVLRMQNILSEHQSLATSADFLELPRSVFQQYYCMSELETPSWFPGKVFDDYRERGRALWSQIFKSNSKHFQKGDNDTLVVDYRTIPWREQDKDWLLNHVPPQIVQESKGLIAFRAREFYEWIGVRPRSSIVSKMFRIISRQR